MPFDVGSVVAHVKADMTDFKKGIGEAKGTLSEFGAGLMDFGKQAAVFTGVATAAIVAFGKQSLDAYNESAAIYAQQKAVLQSTHHAAGLYIEDLQDQAKALQNLTRYSDEAIGGAQNLLLTFTNITGGTFQQATDIVLDMSTALGQDLKSSAIQVGKALQDPVLGVTALRRVGVNFNKAQQEVITKLVETGHAAEAQQLILKELNTEFGKSAVAAGQTFAGQLDILKNKFNDLQERLGAVIAGFATFIATGNLTSDFLAGLGIQEDDPRLDMLFRFRDALMGLANWITQNQPLVLQFLSSLAIGIGSLMVIGTVAAAIMLLTNPLTLVIAAITAFAFAWQTNFLGIRDITSAVVTEVISFFNDYLMPAFLVFQEWWDKYWPSISLMLKGTWDIMVGIIQIAAALIYGIIKVALALISGDWEAAWDAIVQFCNTAWDGIKRIFNGAIEFIKGWGGAMFHELVKPFEDAWNAIQSLVNKIKDALDFTKRHSPSVVDIVKRGVGLVNDALENINMDIPVNARTNLAVNPAGTNSMNNSITIDLSGAVISDALSAQRMGEQIGDSIIKKLGNHVRF